MTRLNYLIILFLLLSTSLLPSCFNRKTDSNSYDLLNKQLIKSTEIIQQGTTNFQMRLEQMTNDPVTAEKAKIWNEKAKSLHLLAINLMSYIDELKLELDSNGKTNEYNKLFEQLKIFQQNALNMDAEIRKNFHKEINALTSNMDSVQGSKENFINTYFSVNSTNAQKSILSKFQNNVAIVENLITAFCSYQIGSGGGGYIVYKPIVTQNATHLRKGEKLLISAGVGTFYNRFRPKVLVNGKEVKINETGEYKYSIDISEKNGKYSIPVQIEYYEWDNEKKQKTLNVEYFIDD